MPTMTATRIKWRRGPVTISGPNNHGYQEQWTHPGYVSNTNLAIWRREPGERWRITHQPSGLMLADIKRIALAKSLVARLAGEFDLSVLDHLAANEPADWETLSAIRRVVVATKAARH